MLPKIHLHLHVSDLEKSRVFYERLFGGPPVKTKAGYVKFLPEFAPLNLAISQLPRSAARPDPTATSIVNHVGVQLASSDDVRAHLARARSAGLAAREEMDVDCCHANQDKFWVVDPDGVEWELYFLRRDLESPALPVVSAECSSGTIACCPPAERGDS